MRSSAGASIAASVKTIAIKVAMFGSIIPTPFATPTTRAAEPEIVALAIFAIVSVVMIARAMSSALVVLCPCIAAIPVRM